MDYEVEVKYMVNGCGKKIQSTRTVVIKKDGKVILEERTQDKIEDILKRVE